MSPIDDELRAALSSRASVVAPPVDPLAGIERRAKQIRRNRIGAAVAGSALAVALVAAVVPAVQNATANRNDVPPFASVQPTTAPAPATSPYALDPENPWTYRGADRELLGPGTLNTIESEFGIRHGLHGADGVELTPLFGQLYGPSEQFTLFFLAELEMPDAGRQYFWGVSETPTDSGPEFLVDEPLADPALALAAALPGDEVPRFIVVADPAVDEIAYSAGKGQQFRTMTAIEDGVGIIGLQGDPASDRYAVSVRGEEIHQAPAPDAPEQPDAGPSSAAALDPEQPWEPRGDTSLVTDGQLDALGDDWAQRHGVDPDGVSVTPLYVQRYPPASNTEVVYLVRSGDGPWSWGVSALGEGGWAWYADQELEPGTAALAATLPGDEVERLLIVAAPWMGGAVYAGDGRDFQPMTDLAPGVFIIGIEGDPAVDRYKVLDGNGDLDNPVAEGDVPPYQNAG